MRGGEKGRRRGELFRRGGEERGRVRGGEEDLHGLHVLADGVAGVQLVRHVRVVLPGGGGDEEEEMEEERR